MSPDQRAAWNFEPGADLGDGRTAIRALGGGERYEAWLGWDDGLCSAVVIKLLRPDHTDVTRSRVAIAREAEVLGRLAHPGIVRCFAAQLDGPRPYLVLEFLDGPRLSSLLRKFGPLSAEQLVPLALEISSALCYMHQQGLLHLDVKPQNVIMGAPPRLIDMSIARSPVVARTISAPLGTEAYMAPEQADPALAGQIGELSDVWGLGATLYEAANGYRPFPKSPRGEPATQLTADPLPMHERVPRALAAILSNCLRREPGERPPLHDLREAFEEMSGDARELAQRRLRRRNR